MLRKQKTNTLTKKSLKLDNKEVVELSMKQGISYKGIIIPMRPPKVTGYIFKIGKVLGGKNKRYFEMNPIECNLIKYLKKECYPKLPKEIYCIANISNINKVPNDDAKKPYYVEVIVWI
jgi:TATA-box binding protein (TBP) (component of TFIID and TFIIIB)